MRTAGSDKTLWGVDLTDVPGFADAVTVHLTRAYRNGMEAALDTFLRGSDTIRDSPPNR